MTTKTTTFALLGMLGLGAAAIASAQMSTPGNFRVSETGAAVYEIPIKVPPGVAGMEPKLSLVYNSQSGNGLLGVGWSLQGLSAISRCPRTMAQDGVRGGVNYDSNDRFCLDGQRLMAVSGAYGADGTEYRTERESFTKITSHGTAGNGPSYFIAKTKSGQTIEYGNSADSKVEAQGKTTVRVWAMNRVQDTKGNYLTATYTEDNANGDYYPSRIDYTGNAITGGVPGHSVRYVYQARTDATPHYVSGALSKTTKRLLNIKTYIGESVLKDYKVDYQYGAATKRSRLSAVTECAGQPTDCISETKLEWQEGGMSWPHGGNLWNFSPAQGFSDASTYPIITGDWNGDGKVDVARVHGSGVVFYVSSGDGTWAGFGGISDLSPGQGYSDANTYPIVTGDWNGDGRTDLARVHGYGVSFYLSAGNGVWYYHGNLASMSPLGHGFTDNNTYPILTGDWNGDGKTDIGRVHGSGITFYLTNGDGSWTHFSNFTNLSPANGYTNGHTYPIFTGDWNGDGKTDIGRVHGSGVLFFTSDGVAGWNYSGHLASLSPAHGFTDGNTYPLVTGDWNGDGKTDIARVHGSGTLFYYSDGSGGDWTSNGYGGPSIMSPAQGYSNANVYPIFVGDWNGDGKADIGRVHGSGVVLYASDGTAWPWFANIESMSPAHGFSESNTYPFITGDWTGDGKTDIARVHGSGITHYVAAAPYPDLLLKAYWHANSFNSITYKPLTDSTVYQKANDGSYPTLNLQMPVYVVSSSSTGNGIGGSVHTNYFYTGLKAELGTGRGLLGFKTVQATDVSTGTKSLTEYRQDWPYVGLPLQSKRIAPDGTTILSQTDVTYACVNPATAAACTIAAGNRYFPHASQSDETSRDLNNTFISKVRTQNSYDSLGNATQIGVTHLDAGGSTTGYGKTTTNTYTNDTSNWLLGRLIRSEVQSTIP